MNRKTAAFLAGLGTLAAIVPVPAGAATAEPVQTLSYAFTANGPTVVLHHWTCWFGANCAYAPCHMTTAKAPALGTLTPRVEPGVVPSSGGRCAGNPVPVLTITYTPRPGVHGADEVVLRSNSDNGFRHLINIHIEIP